jgi:hypothetical protein
MSKNSIVYHIVILILCIICIIKVFNKDVEEFDNSVEQQLRRDIELLIEKQTHWETLAIKYYNSADSLLKIKDSLANSKLIIKTKYEKIYIVIEHASNKQLDSIIRTNL